MCGYVEHVLNWTSRISVESMFNEVEVTFDILSKTAPPLGQKILVVGSMSVIITGGFENSLTGISGFSHEGRSS
jgi:hypothetical protein